LDSCGQEPVTDRKLSDRHGPDIGRTVVFLAGHLFPHEILQQHGLGGLNGSPRQHGGLIVVAKGGGRAVFPSGLRVEFKYESGEEGQDQEGE